MRKSLFVCVLPAFLFCAVCKSPPQAPPEQMPAAALSFDSVKADRIDHIAVYFRFTAENPRSAPLEIEISGWEGALNGAALSGGGTMLSLDGAGAGGSRLVVEGGGAAEKMLVLDLDLADMPAAFGVSGGDEYLANLSLDLRYRYAQKNALEDNVQSCAVFPRIRKPEFTITSIAIMQAELINTRFKVCLRIDNPNFFPVAISSMDYELYGEGRFWAGGEERQILYIPAQSSSETNLFLIMNFINMKRQLLDDVIAMRLVRYRFTGEVEVDTGVSWLPVFHMGFDRRGDSVVLK